MRASSRGPRDGPPGRPPARWGAVLALVAALALAGCLTGGLDEQSDPAADASEAPLPADLTMDGAEVLRRTSDEAAFRWRTDAPVAVAGTTPPGGAETVATTFTVPAGRHVAINVSTAVPDAAGSPAWRASLLDADEDVRCSSRAGTQGPQALPVGNHQASTPGACRLDPVRPLPERRAWTLEVTFGRNADPDATLEAHLTVAATDLRLPQSVGEVRSFAADADDGTTLRGHVYVPEVPGPHPTLLRYGPYLNNAPGSDGDGEDRTTREGNRTALPGWMGRVLDRGYALALVNVRGTGTSDGCNAWLNPHVDGPDAAAVVEAVAGRPWSDGRVGMVGSSWPAFTQYAALREEPEALEAVVPVSSVLDLWNVWTRHGAPFAAPSPAGYAAFQAQTATGPGDEPRHVRCPVYAEHAAAYTGLTVDGDKTSYWQRRQSHGILEGADVPMLVTNGLDRDLEGHILQVQGLGPLLDEEDRLVLGQWRHGPPTATPSGEDWWDLALRWMDHHVKGQGSAPDAGVVDYQDADGAWHRGSSWPPPHEDATLYLSEETLVRSPDDVRASTQTFQSVDASPRPTACRATKALYVSPPVAEDVRLAGRFRANVTVASTAPNSNFAVHAWALDEVEPCPTQAGPDGEPSAGGAQPGEAGLHRAYYPLELSRALSDLRHRGYRTQGEPFPVGEPGLVSMTSDPFAETVEAGERLVVAVSGGSEVLSSEDLDPILRVPTGPDHEGRIDLPVVEGRLTFGEGSGASTGAPSH